MTFFGCFDVPLKRSTIAGATCRYVLYLFTLAVNSAGRTMPDLAWVRCEMEHRRTQIGAPADEIFLGVGRAGISRGLG